MTVLRVALLIAVGSLASPLAAAAAPVILNEYNAVGADVYLDTDEFGGSLKTDTFFGRIQGNGGNWFELVVVDDHVDMRGWSLNWDYFDDADNQGSGVLALTNDPLWSDLRSGTILTFGEFNAAEPAKTTPHATDVSYNPAGGDWWIHVRSDSTQFVGTSGSIIDGGVMSTLPAGEFSVNNDDWSLEIRDAMDSLIYGPAGEGFFSDGGINSNEVFKLEFPGPGGTLADWQSITPSHGSYTDGTSSSFGAPNVWTTDDVGFMQDFSQIQNVPEPSTWLLAAAGSTFVSLAAIRRRRRRA